MKAYLPAEISGEGLGYKVCGQTFRNYFRGHVLGHLRSYCRELVRAVEGPRTYGSRVRETNIVYERKIIASEIMSEVVSGVRGVTVVTTLSQDL